MRGFVENVFFLFRAQAAENPYLFFFCCNMKILFIVAKRLLGQRSFFHVVVLIIEILLSNATLS